VLSAERPAGIRAISREALSEPALRQLTPQNGILFTRVLLAKTMVRPASEVACEEVRRVDDMIERTADRFEHTSPG
jgi:hypothetical protein